jgi:hypothetical protein
MTPPDPGADPAAERRYDERAARFATEHQDLDRRSRQWATVRLVLAALIAASGVWWWRGGGVLAAVAAALAIAAFALAAWRHLRVDDRAARAALMARLNRDAAARCRRAWDQLDDFGPASEEPADPGHPYASDLDVFGHASLWRLLGRARSREADRCLREWLRTPADPDEIRARQDAARSLAPALEWRQQLAVAAIGTRTMRREELEHFLAWCEAGPWLRRYPWIYTLAAMLSVAGIAAVAVRLAGGVPTWWVSTTALALVLSLAAERRLARGLEDASWQVALRGWREVFALAAGAGSESPSIAARRSVLAAGGTAAPAALDALDRLLGLAALRHTPILHWPIQILTLWDFHVEWALERWQRTHGRRVRAWMTAAAEVEALSALGGLAHDHPAWCWPDVDPAADELTAVTLAHPLLPPGLAVANDVVLGPRGRVLLVTGSNMSGKSTLLRAIGLDVVLAQAGGPACAAALRMPPLDVVTSMRLADSLEDGVSFFKASLARLALVVDRARSATVAPERPAVLYLLDELLSGTNTAEREVAVRGVVGHLAACRAFGVLTSHDLALAEAPELAGCARCVHFRETLGERDGQLAMSFDYRLRPGVATSRNALALMRVMGLGAVLGESGQPQAHTPDPPGGVPGP